MPGGRVQNATGGEEVMRVPVYELTPALLLYAAGWCFMKGCGW